MSDSLATIRNNLQDGPEAILASDESTLALASEAESIAKYFALNMNKREEVVSGYTNIFQHLELFWRILSYSFDPSSSTTTHVVASEDSRISLSLALGKMERNLVAGIQDYQEKAADHEEWVRRCIFHLTTFTRIEDPKFFQLQAVLTQLLSNIISPPSSSPGADRLADRYLRMYLSGGRDEDVIIRLLDSRDAKTNISTLHLLNNLIRASPERLQLLLDEPGVGVRWCAKVLGRLDEWADPSQDTMFELGCSIFNAMINQSLHPKLFKLLSSPSEVLSPSQTTLLKILDSHLASSTSSSSTCIPAPDPNSFLVPLFRDLSLYALQSMTEGRDDPRLPKIFEGVVLISEGLSSVGLRVQEFRDKGLSTKESGEEQMVRMIKSDDEGVVKSIVHLLRALIEFFPRIRLPPGTISSDENNDKDELAPFSNLKRDLVQLLGILCYEDISVGNQVREVEGIQLILSLTELDEKNPFLREHALFCVRNLMRNNPENQAIIQQMDPVGVLSDSGEVVPLPEKMKRTVNKKNGNGNGLEN